MTDDERIERAVKIVAERERTVQTEVRPQPVREQQPTYFQKSREREGDSSWSGGSGGGGTWAGRSR